MAGSAAAYGDWREAFALSDRIREVTEAEVVEVARRYLRDDALTVAVLRPSGPERP